MLSEYAEGAPPPIPRPFNMAAHVLARGAAEPDRIALRVVGEDRARTLRYGEIIDRVRRIAAGLLSLGSRPGDRVLIRLGNTVDYPLVYLGAIGAGLVPVATSPMLTPAETGDVIAITEPRIVVHAGDVPCPETRATRIDPERLAGRAAPLAAWHMGDPDRPAYIVFTSGTSGQPRAVVHAHRAILARAMMIRDWYDLGPGDRLLHAGAFNWTYTMGTGLMDPWTVGAEAVILEPGAPLEQLPSILARERATIFAAAPGVYRRILKQGGPLHLPALRHGLSAGEKMAEPLIAAWHAATGRAVHEAFGMSECSTFISGAPHRPAARGFIGLPQRGRRVALVDGEGRIVPRGTEGEIAVHRSDPGLFLGYLGAADETAARFRGEWFVTGDLGLMREDGQIAYCGRVDDMMNAGGFRVSPIEVENALRAHPGIDDCAAVELRLDAATSVIALAYTGPAPLDEEELKAFAADRLARYKQPRIWVRLPDLPRGANGKLSRRLIRHELKARSQ